MSNVVTIVSWCSRRASGPTVDDCVGKERHRFVAAVSVNFHRTPTSLPELSRCLTKKTISSPGQIQVQWKKYQKLVHNRCARCNLYNTWHYNSFQYYCNIISTVRCSYNSYIQRSNPIPTLPHIALSVQYHSMVIWNILRCDLKHSKTRSVL